MAKQQFQVSEQDSRAIKRRSGKHGMPTRSSVCKWCGGREARWEVLNGLSARTREIFQSNQSVLKHQPIGDFVPEVAVNVGNVFMQLSQRSTQLMQVSIAVPSNSVSSRSKPYRQRNTHLFAPFSKVVPLAERRLLLAEQLINNFALLKCRVVHLSALLKHGSFVLAQVQTVRVDEQTH